MQSKNRNSQATLAWFKLAELVMRKEREKALNVYRLLAHSFENRAYALQLEGDILWYLDDKGCAHKYKEAALLYQREKRWFDAIAVYEHLYTVAPAPEYLLTLLKYYALVDWKEKAEHVSSDLARALTGGAVDEVAIMNGFKNLVDEDEFAASAERRLWVWGVGQPLYRALSPAAADQIEKLLK